MELTHTFTVPLDVDEAWRLLLDVERIAPCMPGAALESVEGDDMLGSVKVKVGPINLTYKGSARFVEKDEAGHRLVMDGKGKDARGNGTASAHVVATLVPSGPETRVDVHTDLAITGKPAQFGRGVIVDVSNKLLNQFVGNLRAELAPASGAASADPAVAAAEEITPPPLTKPVTETRQPVREVEPIDLMAAAGPAVAKRLAPVAAVAALAVGLWLVLRRRR